MSIIVSGVGDATAIAIRDIDVLSEMHMVEALQKEVWGIDDVDVVPLTMLVASREVGAVLVGAYDGPRLAGFVYGFPGYENRHFVHHSHMLAVKPAYRSSNLGFNLKLAQRERVLAQGIKRITWTFDPLQSLNAYLNFVKLGVVADSYKVDFYGETTSSFLHQMGTDRLWVTWLLDSQRVRERLQSDTKQKEQSGLEGIPFLVDIDPTGAPQSNELNKVPAEPHLRIAIPADINALQKSQPQLAVKWRDATRRAFTEAIASGYRVEEFDRLIRRDRSVGVYGLSYRKSVS